jgi:hypothetical protein
MSETQDTWARRELPILRIAVRDADDNPQFEDIATETGLTLKDVSHGARALHDAGYLDAAFAGVWSGFVLTVTERARRELGAWPSPESLAEQLVRAFADAAERETDPERKEKLRAVVDTAGGIARGVIVEVAASVLRQVGHLP